MLTVAFIGGFTAIFAASMGLVATDIKRVMAFSTVSQLGYMMLAMGADNEAAGAFHLFTHAFFKALLFLTAGSVIYALHRAGAPHVGHVETQFGRAQLVPAQDIRVMGGLRTQDADHLLDDGDRGALAGGHPAAGRASGARTRSCSRRCTRPRPVRQALYWLLFAFALITVFLTAFYTFRMIFLTFGGTGAGRPGCCEHVRESPLTMTLPLLILAVPSVLVGLWGAPQLGNGFAQFLEGRTSTRRRWTSGWPGSGRCWRWPGSGWPTLMYSAQHDLAAALTARFRPIYLILFNRYWIDELYCWLMDKFIIAVAFGMSWFDRNVVDGVVNGVGKGTTVAGDWLRGLQTGQHPVVRAGGGRRAGHHRLLGRLLRGTSCNLLTARPLWT